MHDRRSTSGPAPSRRALIPLFLFVVCLLGSGGTPPSGVVGQPFPGESNVVCPAYDASKLPTPLKASPTVEAGAVAGSFNVSAAGQATYTIPIVVPPGRLGMEPNLSIAYNSSRGGASDEPLGVGFALQGLSAITRCPSNLAQDGHIRAVRYDEQDKFCLDGLRLVPVPRAEGEVAPDTLQWRTFPDTFRRVTSHFGTDPNLGPDRWTVYEKDGRIRQYGFRPDSQAMAKGGVVAAWWISREHDRRGNEVAYEYQNDPFWFDGHTQEILPSAIAYSGHGKVTFTYEATTPTTLFAGGLSTVKWHLLTRIDTWALPEANAPSEALVRSYRLDYDRGKATHRRRLRSVEECAGDGACKPPTRFTWTDHPLGFSQTVTEVTLPAYAQSVQLDQGFGSWTLADVNGDGLDDLVVVYPNAQNPGMDDWNVALNIGGTFGKPEVWATLGHPATLSGCSVASPSDTGSSYSVNEENYSLTPMDYDQDGNADIFVDTRNPDSTKWPEYMVVISRPQAKLGERFLLHHTAVPQPDGVPLSCDDPIQSKPDSIRYARVGDVNGDGIGDLIECWNPTWDNQGYNPTLGTPIWSVRLWVDDVPSVGGPGWDPTRIIIPGTEHLDCGFGRTQVHIVDLDGSGVSSIVMPDASAGYVALRHEHGSWTKVPTSLQPQSWEPFGNTRQTHWLDVNGDGLPDAIFTGLGTPCAPGGGACENPQNLFWLNGWPWDVPFVAVNNGASFGVPTGTLTADLGGKYMTDWEGDQAVHLDYDGDGRTDFMMPVFGQCPDGDPDHACFVVLRAPPAVEGYSHDPSLPLTQGTFEVIPTPVGEIIDSDTTVPHTWFKPQVTDVDGDGRHDLVAPSLLGDGTFTVYRNSGPQDLLVEITDGMSPLDPADPGFVPTVSITYDSLVDRSITSGLTDTSQKADGFVYLKQSDPENHCHYPMSCVVGTSRVVAEYAMNDGQNRPRRFSIKYRDGRYHRLGRGMIGFEERIVLDEDTGAGSVDVYDNATWDDKLRVFPFAGQVTRSLAWAPADAQPTGSSHPSAKPTQVEMTDSYTELHEVSVNPKTYFTFPKTAGQVRREGTFHPGKGKTLEDYARKAQATATVLSDASSVVDEIDKRSGVVTSARSSTKGVDLHDTLTRTVKNDVGHWLLGEVTYEEACSKALGQTQCRATSRTFNGYGEVTEMATGDPLDPDTQLTTAYLRDDFGNVKLTMAYDEAGHYRSTCTSYEPQGIFPYATVNQLGHTTLFAYDAVLGLLTGSVDPNGLATRLRHDGFGRLTEGKHPDGSSVGYSLTRHKDGGPHGDWWNVKEYTEVRGGAHTTRELDSLGRPVHGWARVADTKSCGASTCSGVLELEQETTYDHLGRVSRVTVPWMTGDKLTGKLADAYEHDATGRVIRHVAPWGRTTTYAYKGNVVSATDWLGTTEREVDAAGRLVKVTDKTGGTVETVYGSFSLPHTVTRFGSESTITERDAYGRTVEESDPDRGTTFLRYDGLGELLTLQDAAMRHVAFTYDPIGRQIERDDIAGGETLTTLWTYDTAANGVGKLAEVRSPAGHVDTYAYSLRSQLREHTLTFGDTGESFTAALDYDAYGRVHRVTYPQPPGIDPLTVRREHDGYGNVVALRDQATNASYWQVTELDGAGRPKEEVLGNGVVVTHEHAPESGVVKRIRAEHLSKNATTTVQDLGYAYDVGLRMISRTDNLQKGLLGPLGESFGYDSINRVTCATVNALPLEGCASPIDYEPNGNIKTKDGLAYAYDPVHPHAVQTVGTGSYQHDAVGNQTLRADGTSISYAPFDLPERYTFPSTVNFLTVGSVDFEYDGQQHRIRKSLVTSAGATTRETAYLDELYERVRDQTGDTHRFYVGAGSARVVLTRSSGAGNQVAYALTDALGSVDVLTDASGGVIEHRSYDAFGARRNPQGWGPWQGALTSSVTPVGFEGLEADDEAGLVNMRGRVYDPKIGRFLSADPIVSFPGFGQSWNPYSYVLNSPLNLTDPNGFEPGTYQSDSGKTEIINEMTIVGDKPSAPQPGAPDATPPAPAAPPASAAPNAPADANRDDTPGKKEPPEPPQKADKGSPAEEVGKGIVLGFASHMKGLFMPSVTTWFRHWSGIEMTGNAIRGARQDGARGFFAGAINTLNPLYNHSVQAIEADKKRQAGDIKGATEAYTELALSVATTVGGFFAGGAGKGAPEAAALKGPPATAALAELIQGKVPLSAQTIALLETIEGPTLVAGGAADLTAAQKAAAQALGLTPVPDLPGFHAEQTAIQGAADLNLTPTRGVATNIICDGRCGQLIKDIGGWYDGRDFGF